MDPRSSDCVDAVTQAVSAQCSGQENSIFACFWPQSPCVNGGREGAHGVQGSPHLGRREFKAATSALKVYQRVLG